MIGPAKLQPLLIISFFVFIGSSIPSDIIFAIDTADKTSYGDLTHIRQFITNMLTHFVVSPTQTHVALLNYGYQTEKVLDIGANKKENVLRALFNLRRIGGERVLSGVFGAVQLLNMRENVVKNLVVFIRGKPTSKDVDKYVELSKKLRSQSIKIIIVALNKDLPMTTLAKITGAETRVIFVDGSSALPTVIDEIDEVIGTPGNDPVLNF